MTDHTWTDCIVDVSHNNGEIDWARVDPGIVLVFVKASQGAHFRDPLFVPNRDGIVASGRLCIPYHFISADDVDAQIANFEAQLAHGQPFMLDWEGRAAHTLTPDDVEYMGAQIADDIGTLAPVGYWGIRGSAPGAATMLMRSWTKFTPRYPVTGAEDFSRIPAHDHDLILDPIWQYTQWGQVRGIGVQIDRSVFAGTAAELRALYARLTVPAPVVAS